MIIAVGYSLVYYAQRKKNGGYVFDNLCAKLHKLSKPYPPFFYAVRNKPESSQQLYSLVKLFYYA